MSEKTIAELQDEAIMYINNKKYDQCTALLTRIIHHPHASNYDKAMAYLGKGIAYSNLGQYEKAIDDFTETIELATDDHDKAMAYYNRGLAYRNLEQYEKAIDDFTETIELATDDHDKAKAYHNRGLAYNALRQYKEAIEDFTHAIELFTDDNDNADAYYDRGNAYSGLKQYKQAIEDFTNAIELSKEDHDKAQTYNNRGIAYNELQQYEQAIKDFTHAIELATDNNIKVIAYLNRGNAHSNLEQYEQAREDFKRARRMNPTDASLQGAIAAAEETIKSKKSREKVEAVREQVAAVIGEGRAVGLAKEYEEKKEELQKSLTRWTVFSIGSILMLLIPPSLVILFPCLIKSSVICIEQSGVSWNTAIHVLPFVLPLVWLASFCVRRRSETRMLLAEYSHKTIFAKSYLAHVAEAKTLEKEDTRLQTKLLDTLITITARNPEYIFSKKHKNDLPLEDIKEFIGMAEKMKALLSPSGVLQAQDTQKSTQEKKP